MKWFSNLPQNSIIWQKASLKLDFLFKSDSKIASKKAKVMKEKSQIMKEKPNYERIYERSYERKSLPKKNSLLKKKNSLLKKKTHC